MFIEDRNLSDWVEVRYQIVCETGRAGSYTAWDIVSFYDQGIINEETQICLENSVSSEDCRLGDTSVFKARRVLRGFGNLGQALIVVELEKLNVMANSQKKTLYKLYKRFCWNSVGTGLFALFIFIKLFYLK